jgi:hypothetical protein
MPRKKKPKEPENHDVVGTPTMLLLPSRNYKFKVFENPYRITLPRRGKYVDIDDKIFSEKDGEFDLLQYSEKEEGHILFMPAISRVLFATNQYPDLKDGYAFTPVAIIFKEEEVEIIGNLIEMVQKET